jgi:hypothetical protein
MASLATKKSIGQMKVQESSWMLVWRG